jgi:hypothetical protein
MAPPRFEFSQERCKKCSYCCSRVVATFPSRNELLCSESRRAGELNRRHILIIPRIKIGGATKSQGDRVVLGYAENLVTSGFENAGCFDLQKLRSMGDRMMGLGKAPTTDQMYTHPEEVGSLVLFTSIKVKDLTKIVRSFPWEKPRCCLPRTHYRAATGKITGCRRLFQPLCHCAPYNDVALIELCQTYIEHSFICQVHKL